MGEGIGVQLTKSTHIIIAVIITFIMGMIITIAEPDLQVLAHQVPSVPQSALMLTVGVGVGIFLVVAVLRTLFKIKLSALLLVFYILTFILAVIPLLPIDSLPQNLKDMRAFIPVAFDSGGVTTGPITVPFIMAMGVGVASIRSDKGSQSDSFGLIALCSVGPIIAVLILGIIYDPTAAEPTMHEIVEAANSRVVVESFALKLPEHAEEVIMAMGAIVVFFIVFEIATRRFKKHQIGRIIVGFVYTFIGLVVFLTGVNVGFIPVGQLLGSQIASDPTPWKWILVPFAMLVGYFIVAAEPAVHVLNKQVEEISSGAVTAKLMLRGLSIGMAIALGVTMVRILLGINLMWILIPGYAFALILTFFVPPIFTGIAFDSGGVCSGPMTSTFLLPFAMGACKGVGGDLMKDAFGIVAMVAMTPLIIIQIMGIIFNIKQKKTAAIQVERMAGTIGTLSPEEAGGITVYEDLYA